MNTSQITSLGNISQLRIKKKSYLRPTLNILRKLPIIQKKFMHHQ